MSMKRYLYGSIGAIILIVTVVGGVTASGLLTVYQGERIDVQSDRPVSAGLLIGVDYQPTTAKVITAPDGRSVAQLAYPPGELTQSLAITIPAKGNEDKDAPQPPSIDGFAWKVLASIKYIGNSQTVYVTTVRPSPSLRSKTLLLGDPTTLGNGEKAWTSHASDAPLSQVIITRGNLLISVAGDVSLDTLKALASSIEIKGEQP